MHSYCYISCDPADVEELKSVLRECNEGKEVSSVRHCDGTGVYHKVWPIEPWHIFYFSNPEKGNMKDRVTFWFQQTKKGKLRRYDVDSLRYTFDA